MAFSVTLTPGTSAQDGDTYLDMGDPAVNYSTESIKCGLTLLEGEQYRPLLIYDLSSIPDGANIASSNMTVDITAVTGTPVKPTIRRFVNDGGTNGDVDVTAVTWDDFNGADPWGTAGGGALIGAGSFTFEGTITNGDQLVWSGTAANTILKHAMVNDNRILYLLWTTDSGAGNKNFTFGSGESGNHPTLIISYTLRTGKMLGGVGR